MKKQKIYNSAPLPFVGQKRRFVAEFRQLLAANIPDQGAGWTVVDAFGGSGLLAHNAARTLPRARVIYNDFDGYAARLQMIPDSNRLRARLRHVLGEMPTNTKLSAAQKQAALDAIRAFDGAVDWRLVMNWLLFSGKQPGGVEALEKEGFFYKLTKADYCAEGYLDGLEITSAPFAELLPRFDACERVLLVLDPPYPRTKQGMYANKTYFGMVEFLRLLALIKHPFVFFAGSRSELTEYIALTKEHQMPHRHLFDGCEMIRKRTAINCDAAYIDQMLYRFTRPVLA